MGKVPVRLKEVVYALSPFEQEIMGSLYKGASQKLMHRIHSNWVNAIYLFGPIAGTYWYAENYREKEKLQHRY